MDLKRRSVGLERKNMMQSGIGGAGRVYAGDRKEAGAGAGARQRGWGETGRREWGEGVTWETRQAA